MDRQRPQVRYAMMQFLLRKYRTARGMTQEQMADLLGVSVSLYNGLENGKRRMNADYIQKSAEIFGIEPADLIASTERMTAVVGRVGAGAMIWPDDTFAKGDGMYSVPCPPQLKGRNVVAVEVVGDSMEPVYNEGDVLFYERDHMGVDDQAIGEKCICEDTDGRFWVKQIKRGTDAGLFRLLSINPSGENILDTRLRWASPVLLHIPKNLISGT